MKTWWVRQRPGSLVQGPYTERTLLENIKRSRLKHEAFVSEDNVNWLPAESALAHLFQQANKSDDDEGLDEPLPPHLLSTQGTQPSGSKTPLIASAAPISRQRMHTARPNQRRLNYSRSVSRSVLWASIISTGLISFALGAMATSLYQRAGRTLTTAGTRNTGGVSGLLADVFSNSELKAELISGKLEDPVHHLVPNGTPIKLSDVQHLIPGSGGLWWNPIKKSGELPLVLRIRFTNTTDTKLIRFRGLNSSPLENQLLPSAYVMDEFKNRYELTPLIDIPLLAGSLQVANNNPAEAISEPLQIEPGRRANDWIAITPKSPLFKSKTLTVVVPSSRLEGIKPTRGNEVLFSFPNPVYGKQSIPLR